MNGIVKKHIVNKNSFMNNFEIIHLNLRGCLHEVRTCHLSDILFITRLHEKKYSTRVTYL